MSLELKYIMILSSSTLEKSDFLDVFVSKARWDCPTLVTLRTLMSTRLGTLAQNTVISSRAWSHLVSRVPELGRLSFASGAITVREFILLVIHPALGRMNRAVILSMWLWSPSLRPIDHNLLVLASDLYVRTTRI